MKDALASHLVRLEERFRQIRINWHHLCVVDVLEQFQRNLFRMHPLIRFGQVF